MLFCDRIHLHERTAPWDKTTRLPLWAIYRLLKRQLGRKHKEGVTGGKRICYKVGTHRSIRSCVELCLPMTIFFFFYIYITIAPILPPNLFPRGPHALYSPSQTSTTTWSSQPFSCTPVYQPYFCSCSVCALSFVPPRRVVYAFPKEISSE